MRIQYRYTVGHILEKVVVGWHVKVGFRASYRASDVRRLRKVMASYPSLSSWHHLYLNVCTGSIGILCSRHHLVVFVDLLVQ